MDFDFSGESAEAADHQSENWLDDIGDFFSSVGSRIADFVMPDGLGEVFAGEPAPPTEVVGSTGDLPNDGFYQSMPGIDSFVGSVLDQNAQLCTDIDEFGKETFGEQAWAEAGVVAAADPYGMLDGIETPSDMWARFHKEDAQANARFEDWRWNQEQINDAEDLVYNMTTLLRYGY
jgi:hypothetical protein